MEMTMTDETMSTPAKPDGPLKPPRAVGYAAKPPITLDEAAAGLLPYLPPPMVELIDTLCKEHHTKPAAYLLAYCRLAYDRGETAAYVAEDDARRADTGEPASLFAGTESRCAYCNTLFKPSRIGQRFCPEPDDGTPGCGRRNTLETMHAGREAYLRKTRPERDVINRIAAPRVDATTM